MKKYRILADALTGLRILCSIILLFPPVFSVLFYSLYIICGISDMLDGHFARKIGKESSYGARLDSIADICFVTVCLLKLLPVICLEVYIILLICLAALIRAVNILIGLVKYKRLIFLHTPANKLAGAILFLLPLVLDSSIAGCVIHAALTAALFASVQEGYFVLSGRNIDYSEN